MTPRDINKIVAKHFGVTMAGLESKSMKRPVINARSAAMLLCQQLLHKSSYNLCRIYDKKSHSTTLNALKVAKNMLDTDKEYRFIFYKAKIECEQYMIDWPEKKQRYNLHYRVRAKGMNLNCKTKTVSITPDQAGLLQDSQMRKLLDQHNYAIQFSIL